LRGESRYSWRAQPALPTAGSHDVRRANRGLHADRADRHGRIGAALIAINMLAAIALAHRTELLHMNQFGGWALEYQGLLLATAVGLLLIGPGASASTRALARIFHRG
jgi:hypothetical protein